MSEQWAAVDGYEGLYAVSDRGNVMSMNYAKSKLPGMMSFNLRRGYRSVFFRKTGQKGRWFTVHTLVARAFIGERPLGKFINHKNGIKIDNRVENLEYCTSSENSKHNFKIGLQCNKGENHSRHKLTDEKVTQIREWLAQGRKQGEIAREMGVSAPLISRINSGKNWSHLLVKEGG